MHYKKNKRLPFLWVFTTIWMDGQHCLRDINQQLMRYLSKCDLFCRLVYNNVFVQQDFNHINAFNNNKIPLKHTWIRFNVLISLFLFTTALAACARTPAVEWLQTASFALWTDNAHDRHEQTEREQDREAYRTEHEHGELGEEENLRQQ